MHGVTLRHSVIAVVAIFGNCDILNLEGPTLKLVAFHAVVELHQSKYTICKNVWRNEMFSDFHIFTRSRHARLTKWRRNFILT